MPASQTKKKRAVAPPAQEAQGRLHSRLLLWIVSGIAFSASLVAVIDSSMVKRLFAKAPEVNYHYLRQTRPHAEIDNRDKSVHGIWLEVPVTLFNRNEFPILIKDFKLNVPPGRALNSIPIQLLSECRSIQLFAAEINMTDGDHADVFNLPFLMEPTKTYHLIISFILGPHEKDELLTFVPQGANAVKAFERDLHHLFGVKTLNNGEDFPEVATSLEIVSDVRTWKQPLTLAIPFIGSRMKHYMAGEEIVIESVEGDGDGNGFKTTTRKQPQP